MQALTAIFLPLYGSQKGFILGKAVLIWVYPLTLKFTIEILNM